jgi:hypothetical protein
MFICSTSPTWHVHSGIKTPPQSEALTTFSESGELRLKLPR